MPTENHQQSQSGDCSLYASALNLVWQNQADWFQLLAAVRLAALGWLSRDNCPQPPAPPITTRASDFCTAASSWKTCSPIFTGHEAFSCLTFLPWLSSTFQPQELPQPSSYLGSVCRWDPSALPARLSHRQLVLEISN